MSAQRGRCKYCGQTVAWVLTSKNRPMPLDPEPNPKGNVYVTGTVQAGRDAGTPVVIVLRRDELPPEQTDLYMAHFATCEKYPARKAAR